MLSKIDAIVGEHDHGFFLGGDAQGLAWRVLWERTKNRIRLGGKPDSLGFKLHRVYMGYILRKSTRL
jgi:hypothetical protein